MPDFVIKSRKKREFEHIVVTNNLPSVNEFINDCLRFSIENLKIMEDVDEE